MTYNILIISLLTFLIHFVGTIAYAVRIVGIRTGKNAISWAMFNIISLFARVATTFQAPLLAKTIENNIHLGKVNDVSDFRIIIFAATLATCVGAFAIPTAHRFLQKGVESLYHHQSMTKVIWKIFRLKTFFHFWKSLTWPKLSNLSFFLKYRDIPLKIMFLQAIVNAVLTVSVLSCLYAGYLNPSLRSTTASMTGVANSVAVILSLVFLDPNMAILTDRVLAGKKTQAYFRKYFVFVVFSRLIGTILGQLLLIPIAHFVIYIAENLYV
ncbi:Lipid II flippase Amj [Emticicia aquatica]|jgi:hypothetical protein|uniref:Lipid II flippase Amj n=1 Tax=Emticicia aquatica TaxID=1681835 RepID=A0ABN8EY13_9BACT|nr:DUF2837 family protein [Emticicia aquatica]CAH0997995.1 Lipid II flippase Amj [Emticicia aquatica]